VVAAGIRISRQWSAVALPHRNGLTLPCGLYLHRPSGEHRLLFLANDTWSGITGPASHYVGSLELDAARTYRRVGPALATVHVFSQAITSQCLDYHGKLPPRGEGDGQDPAKLIYCWPTYHARNVLV
jgi:hypothetical protein